LAYVCLFATGFKKGESQGQTMSLNTYDAQKTGKGCKMSAHHVPLRQMIHTTTFLLFIMNR
jgi:hypothetical protein